MDATRSWLFMQLTDSAFPTGGFVHSSGLEAAWQLREVTAATLPDYLEDSLTQCAWTQLPFALATHQDPGTVLERDRDLDLRLLVPAGNRASRAQGTALLATCAKTLRTPAIIALRARARLARTPGHWAPWYGAITRLCDLPEEPSLRGLLYLQLRSLISTAVRLGACGPLEGQHLQCRMAPFAENLLQSAAGCSWGEAAQPMPMLELLQGCHDRLYSRLFSS